MTTYNGAEKMTKRRSKKMVKENMKKKAELVWPASSPA